jgi:hypothetical protein
MTGYANTTDSVKTVENEAAAAKYWHDMYVATSQKAQELEALLERQTSLLERQTARIVDLQAHIENFDGEE